MMRWRFCYSFLGTLFIGSSLWAGNPKASTGDRFYQGRDLFFRVAGVAPDDQLNVRARPRSKSRILTTLAHDAPFVEINGKKRKWFRINAGEETGWVYSKYLEPIKIPTYPNTNLPMGLRCHAEEPFDSFHLQAKEILYRAQGKESESFTIESLTAKKKGTKLEAKNKQGVVLQLHISEEQGSSTMVEAYYNWTFTATLDGKALTGGVGCTGSLGW